MPAVTPDRCEDIKDALIEASVQVSLAIAGAKIAEQGTSDREVRYSVDAVSKCLGEIDAIIREARKMVDQIISELEIPDDPEPEQPVVEAPKSAAQQSRPFRGQRGRRGE